MQVAVEQRLHQRNATYFKHVFGNITAARLQIRDVKFFLKISATSNKLNLMPHPWAIAGRCSAALVEPPEAATTAAAFSRASRVTMSVSDVFLDQLHHLLAAAQKVAGRRAQAPRRVRSARPIASETVAMVLENWVPQAPADGHATARSRRGPHPTWRRPSLPTA